MSDMNDMINPYQSPETQAAPLSGAATGHTITETMLSNLKAASPWLRFMGIIGFIGCGFLVLVGIAALLGMGTLARSLGSVGDSLSSSFSGGIGLLSGALYMGIGALTFFPALFTYRFGAKIRRYAYSGSSAELEAAFKNNRLLWLFNGILTIVSLAAVPVIIIITIFAAIAAINL